MLDACTLNGSVLPHPVNPPLPGCTKPAPYMQWGLICHFPARDNIHKITCKVASSCYSHPKKQNRFSKITWIVSSHKRGRGRKKVGGCFKGKVNTSNYTGMIYFGDELTYAGFYLEKTNPLTHKLI